MAAQTQTDCFICRKHRGEATVPGGAILDSRLVYVSHGYHDELNPEPYLGHVVVEPKRHAPGVDDLTDEEAAAVGVSGVVLTKLDGSAKGGVAIAIANELGLPVTLVGVGEGLDDLRPFDPGDFARALLAG